MRILVLGVCLASAPAWAGKVKGSLACTTDGKVTLPTSDSRKLDKPIHCTVKLEGGDADVGEVAIVVDGKEAPGGNGELDDKKLAVDLQPGSTYPSCKDFTIVARLHVEAGPVWEGKIAVKQLCPAAVAWEGDALPADAATPLAVWVGGYLALDQKFYDAWPSGGVTIKKKAITAKAAKSAGGVYLLTNIMPLVACKDPDKDPGHHPENCSWGKWTAIVKSKTEVWIYSPGESGYGAFGAAVFKKKGDRWTWTAVETYDTGEP